MGLVAHAVTLAVGAAVGLASVAVHRSTLGLALAIVTTLAVLLCLRQWRLRLVVTFAVGWLVPVTIAVLGKPEGDYAVASDLFGYALMGLGLAVLAAGAASVSARDSRSSAPRT